MLWSLCFFMPTTYGPNPSHHRYWNQGQNQNTHKKKHIDPQLSFHIVLRKTFGCQLCTPFVNPRRFQRNHINHTSLQTRGVTRPKPKGFQNQIKNTPVCRPGVWLNLNPRRFQNQINHTSLQTRGVTKPKPKDVPEPNQPHQFAGQGCDYT